MGNLMRLAVTSGEPAGIGPDLLLSDPTRLHDAARDVALVVLGDRRVFAERAKALGVAFDWPDYVPDQATPGTISLLHHPVSAPVHPGRLDPANGQYVLDLLNRAADGCRQGEFDAMVTAPVHKGVINDAGITFTGHTEYLADRVGGHPVMMLASGSLRVALVTTHLPLRAVADAINAETLHTVISTVHHALADWLGIPKPRLLVAGLNPHAGESGHLGDEELRIIGPVLELLRAEGMNLVGPLPADTLFTPRNLAQADGVVAMYHDQGLPVLKHVGFGNAVNITLGLPIIRTSVDHGTALDLAATGKADMGSLIEAIRVAAQMADRPPRDSSE